MAVGSLGGRGDGGPPTVTKRVLVRVAEVSQRDSMPGGKRVRLSSRRAVVLSAGAKRARDCVMRRVMAGIVQRAVPCPGRAQTQTRCKTVESVLV